MSHRPQKNQKGIWKHDEPDVKVADVSYTSAGLARIVARAWINNNNYKRDLLSNNTQFIQTQILNEASLKLQNPVVITEKEYNDGWDQDSDNQVVFVLPDVERVNKTNQDTEDTLLETAKMLMACVPNGI